MAAKQAAFWPLFFLLACAWILLLSGVAALQQNCNSSNASNPLLGAGTVAYLSPVTCSKFFRFTWWITWYLFAILIVLAAFAATRAFHTFRRASAPLLVLLMDTANTYFYFNGLDIDGTLKARARVTLAGAIIACVALGALLLVIGIFDEAQGVAARRGGTGEPKGETYGGVFQPTEAQTGAAEAATYAYPARA
ncbi:hypothetical protein D9Q98_007311 [Chlorella vulgaris]|uniref:Uncharacterized protein n=1 Tax=Chlorella vulgaris TaxID=3077 RepID=A0A9D4YVG6_CHLVU|nr:hypothetical protein D9Q98_007311 [Chlorella vulgaris]